MTNTNITNIVTYTNQLLAIDRCKDYCPNGWQVQGKSEIHKIAAAVTADQASIKAAIMANADLLLVHHGYFWRGEADAVVGMKYQRLSGLIKHDINLMAYHLPLDIHAQFGNNKLLGDLLGFTEQQYFTALGTELLGCYTDLLNPITPDLLAQRIGQVLQRQPLVILAENKPLIQRVAWITGAAQDAIEQAAALGCDAFISGEVSERTYYQAKELGIHYFAAGHHATERYGVQALAEHLAQQFSLDYCFIDSNNPI